ncbi:uncharacterized protein LOC133201304 [Saccostrea echinata]|uniref:uncharacterized protein LOC133201209 n=1 Tax=Saccostrea echinata TaxID=191078 RepID=UPI002A8358E4|nr:uncharacterized protein LOC133201209 [Saccostrea echinata]XP_061192998.1 uncharacterized protein LOC133201209 [Saccostrea echinata]XP_061193085.1 uncharacterized protein LOC133201304 [Saccostrea echinata]XP_061193086.1 uncharacterized protein LOC133201304 [Saccostrea echinata]
MNTRHFCPVVILMCWAGEVISMCTIKRYPPSVEEWYSCVPCPPPGKFSLLCSHVPDDCDLLSSLLKVCLSQYDTDYQQWFTEDIKCTEKQACLDRHPSCDSLESDFKVLNVSCIESTESIITTPSLTMSTPSTDRILTTQYLSTPSISTTQVNITQTTNRHVITDVTNFTNPFTAMVNDSILSFTNTSNYIPFHPLKIENHSPNAAIAIVVVIIILLVFIAIAFVVRKAKQNYSVSVRVPLERQSSTSSRAPVIRTDGGYTILCFTLKRRINAHEKGHLSSKETPRGYYSSVQLDETPEFQEDVMKEEEIKINSDYVVCSVEDDVIKSAAQESGV